MLPLPVGSLKSSPDRGGNVYLATYADGDRHGAAMRRHDGPVVFENAHPAAAEAFAHDLAGEHPKLPGIVGTLSACEAFSRASVPSSNVSLAQ